MQLTNTSKTLRRALSLTAALFLASCGPATHDQDPKISDQDRELGAEQHPALLAEFGGAYPGRQADYVAALGKKLATAAGLEEQCTFTLVNSDVVNAFAVPGCYIYVTRGMLALVNSEAELASVLGHELGHIAGAHVQRQEQRSLWRTLAVLAVSLTGSERLTQIAGQAAQFFGLRYSRKQEYDADDFGIRVLKTAGYDPYAAGDMLAALGRNEAYMIASGGHDEARAIPEWVRSHPLTENRVERAHEEAVKTGLKDNELPENEQALLGAVRGLLYGDDPEQGFVEGRRFAHPVMRIAFEAPPGFTLTNSPQAVGLAGPDDARGGFAGGPLPPDGLKSYANALIGQILGEAGAQAQVGPVELVRTNELPSLFVPVRVATQQGALRFDIAVYATPGGRAYHFILVGPATRPAAASTALFRSFRLLTLAEVATLRPRYIQVVKVKPGDTPTRLASAMASDRGEALFRMLNDLDTQAELRPGTQVKLVRRLAHGVE